MRNLTFHFFNNSYDSVVDRNASLPWSEIVELFSEHKATDEKNGFAFVASDFRKEGDYQPATKKINSPTGELLAEKVILQKNGKPAVGRLQSNVLTVEGITLDSDKGWSLEEAIESLEGLTHFGYTSYSHRQETKGDRFRVFIPFSDPCPKEEWVLRRHDVLNLFPKVDHSTVALARLFFLPTCPEGNLGNAFTWNVDADWLDWRSLERLPEPKPITPIDLTKLTRSGYGKVVWETFDAVSFFRDSGLYIRQTAPNKHEVICPNHHNHTNSVKAGTVLYTDQGEWPSFYCSHDHCRDFSIWQHFKDQLGKGWMKNYCFREEELNINSTPLRHIPTK